VATVDLGFKSAARGPVSLGSAQTGNVDSTNTLDRGENRGPGAVVVTSAVGGTPTVKLDIQGSVDGTNWFNIPYALVATPSTFVVTQITITSAVTTVYLLQTGQPWRYLKLVYSSNTNVTLTATAAL
jgi:hypothetical protein